MTTDTEKFHAEYQAATDALADAIIAVIDNGGQSTRTVALVTKALLDGHRQDQITYSDNADIMADLAEQQPLQADLLSALLNWARTFPSESAAEKLISEIFGLEQ